MENIVKILKQGGIGALATDTLYGLVGSALKPKTVERIYKLRRRNLKKPLIILISSLKDLKKFGVRVNNRLESFLNKIWPGPVSVILSCSRKKFSYLHRGTKSLAFRIPAKKDLLEILKKTGPLVAPSANWEGRPPARTIKEAKKYFGNQVDFYVNAGKIIAEPSTLILLKR